MIGRGLGAWILPLAVACAAMAPGITGEFVMDDQLAIVGHPAVGGDAPFIETFTRDFWGGATIPAWRPLATLLFRIEAHTFGLSPLGFHLVSLLLYCIAVLLVRSLALRLCSPRGATLAAVAFAALPIHVEAVSALVGQADLLSLIGVLVCLRLFLAEHVAAAPLAALSFALALFGKESALTLPLVLALFARDRRGWARVAVVGMVALAYVALRLAWSPATIAAHQATDDPLAGASLGMRLLHGLQLVGAYAHITALPIDLCTGRKFSQIAAPDASSIRLCLLGGLLLALSAWSFVTDRRAGRPPLAAAIFASGVLFLGVVPLPEAMADRFALQPSVFFCLLLGRAIEQGLGDRARQRLPIFAGVVVLYTIASGFYATRWHDDLVLMRHAVFACPDSVHDHLRYAEVLDRHDQIDEAAWHFALAARGRQSFPRRWHHPALEAEEQLPAEARLRQLGTLLNVPDTPFRRGLVGALRVQHLEREAERVMMTAP